MELWGPQISSKSVLQLLAVVFIVYFSTEITRANTHFPEIEAAIDSNNLQQSLRAATEEKSSMGLSIEEADLLFKRLMEKLLFISSRKPEWVEQLYREVFAIGCHDLGCALLLLDKMGKLKPDIPPLKARVTLAFFTSRFTTYLFIDNGTTFYELGDHIYNWAFMKKIRAHLSESRQYQHFPHVIEKNLRPKKNQFTQQNHLLIARLVQLWYEYFGRNLGDSFAFFKEYKETPDARRLTYAEIQKLLSFYEDLTESKGAPRAQPSTQELEIVAGIYDHQQSESEYSGSTNFSSWRGTRIDAVEARNNLAARNHFAYKLIEPLRDTEEVKFPENEFRLYLSDYTNLHEEIGTISTKDLEHYLRTGDVTHLTPMLAKPLAELGLYIVKAWMTSDKDSGKLIPRNDLVRLFQAEVFYRSSSFLEGFNLVMQYNPKVIPALEAAIVCSELFEKLPSVKLVSYPTCGMKLIDEQTL